MKLARVVFHEMMLVELFLVEVSADYFYMALITREIGWSSCRSPCKLIDRLYSDSVLLTLRFSLFEKTKVDAYGVYQ